MGFRLIKNLVVLLSVLLGSEYVNCRSVERLDGSYNPCFIKRHKNDTFGLSEDLSQGWILYKDEKCIKLHSTKLVNYDEANELCKKADEGEDSNMISIGSQDEQDFIERFIRKEKIANNVWLSLKFYEDSDQYKWSDRTDFTFRNWGFGSPKNHSIYCVQMESNPTGFGTWTEALCAKRNHVICQKPNYWTYARLQTEVLNLMRNSVPIGYIYVQYRKEDPPEKLWPLATWAKITASIHDPGILWKRIK